VGKVDWDVDAMVRHAAVAVVGGVIDTLEAARTVAAYYTPVDTGWLRASWAVSDVRLEGFHVIGTLYNPVEYAGFVNDGTTKMAGRHMLELAIDLEFPRVGERIVRRWVA
jgi:hypothetical protein